MDNKPKARIVNVIVVTQGEELTYFTLEGIEIGGFRGGRKIVPEVPVVTQEVPKGGIVTSPNPKAVRRAKELQLDKNLTIEERIKYEKEQNS